MVLTRVIGVLGLLLLHLTRAQQTGEHPEWDRWCGKVYKPEYPSFDPGGQTREPPKLPDGLGLYMQFKPRYSIYLESDKEAEFIVRPDISEWYGAPWPSLDMPDDAPVVYFTINLVSNNDVLISNNITVGGDDKVLAFDVTQLEPQLEPYEVVLFAADEEGDWTTTARSEIYYLPEKETGSVTKLDNLVGGMLFRNSATDGKFKPLLPYGFFGSCDNFLCEDDSVEAITAYRELGLNGMVPLTTVFDSRKELELMGDLDLKFMYDLRGIYKNLTEVRRHISAIRDFDAIYAYWGADEPDGWQDPFNATLLSRDVIREIDPYHPIAVTLNCQDYYFGEYTAGTDIIMADVYPIGINSTYSKWGTPVNSTYGDAGCDNCQGNVQDVSERFDRLAQYERWLGRWPKTKAQNPQSFHGEDYWLRDPTVEEGVAMAALGYNHDSKGVTSWLWPTTNDLAKIHGKFASVVNQEPVVDFIVLSKAVQVVVPDLDVLDVAYWKHGNEILVNAVNGGYEALDHTVKIPLPDDVTPKEVKESVWGDGTWAIEDGSLRLSKVSLMSTNMVILSL